MVAGPRTMAEIIGHHLRNIEVHHVDLDIGHHPSDWPSILVEGELRKRLPVAARPGRSRRAPRVAPRPSTRTWSWSGPW